jgi:hypothetical protein
MTRPLRVLAALLALLALDSGSAAAMTVERFEVGQQGAGYFVRLQARLQAPPARVMQVLRDYRGYPGLDPRIVEAHMVGEGPGAPLLFTRLRGCLGWGFCRDMDRYEKVTYAEGVVVAEAIAGRGDLASGRTETRVVADGSGTRVTYRNDFEPSFWMPRWLVQAWMRRTLEEGTRLLFENVEKRAAEAPRP